MISLQSFYLEFLCFLSLWEESRIKLTSRLEEDQ